jgi:hypothetical protein
VFIIVGLMGPFAAFLLFTIMRRIERVPALLEA